MKVCYVLNSFRPFVAGVDNFGSKDKILAVDQLKLCKLGVAGMTT